MFESATLKLTGWYLLIIMGVSLIFSGVIYQLTASEINTRLGGFQHEIEVNPLLSPRFDIGSLRLYQLQTAKTNLLLTLVYSNCVVLIVAGVGSYLLARRTLEPLEKLHVAQSRFTSDASHELRTPLAAMRTEIEVALSDPKTSKLELQQLLASNLEEVNKLSILSETLLRLARLDYGALTKEPLTLDTVVKDVATQLDKTGGRIAITPHAKPLTIVAHPASIQELLTILVENALKHSPPASPVAITLKRQNRHAIITIRNEGPGITPEHLPHIFERFYRGDQSRTGNKTPGYGLGLSLAKRIIELHHGDITVQSTPGSVTNFTIAIPIQSKTINPEKSAK